MLVLTPTEDPRPGLIYISDPAHSPAPLHISDPVWVGYPVFCGTLCLPLVCPVLWPGPGPPQGDEHVSIAGLTKKGGPGGGPQQAPPNGVGEAEEGTQGRSNEGRVIAGDCFPSAVVYVLSSPSLPRVSPGSASKTNSAKTASFPPHLVLGHRPPAPPRLASRSTGEAGPISDRRLLSDSRTPARGSRPEPFVR